MKNKFRIVVEELLGGKIHVILKLLYAKTEKTVYINPFSLFENLPKICNSKTKFTS